MEALHSVWCRAECASHLSPAAFLTRARVASFRLRPTGAGVIPGKRYGLTTTRYGQ